MTTIRNDEKIKVKRLIGSHGDTHLAAVAATWISRATWPKSVTVELGKKIRCVLGLAVADCVAKPAGSG